MNVLASFCLAASLLVPGPQLDKVPPKKNSDITIGTIIYKWKEIDSEMKNLAEYGFTSCQVQYYEQMDREYAKLLRKTADKYGIKITTVVSVPGHCVWNFEEGPSTIGLVPSKGREEKIAIYHRMIDFCKDAGVPAMHSHFGFIPEDMSSPLYKDFVTVMKDLGNYAKERGVMIYFETGQETPITLVRAIKDIGTGNLFINCDVANLMLYGKANPVDALRIFGPLVKDVHAKDGCYPTADHPYDLGAEKPISEGDVDFPEVIKVLKQENYKGALTIEYELNESSKEYLVKTRKYLQKLIDSKK